MISELIGIVLGISMLCGTEDKAIDAMSNWPNGNNCLFTGVVLPYKIVSIVEDVTVTVDDHLYHVVAIEITAPHLKKNMFSVAVKLIPSERV